MMLQSSDIVAEAVAALRLIDISKCFGDNRILKPLSLEVVRGELLALLGSPGCGNTITLRLIAGFEAPNTGSIVINDSDMTTVRPDKRGRGIAFQDYSLFSAHDDQQECRLGPGDARHQRRGKDEAGSCHAADGVPGPSRRCPVCRGDFVGQPSAVAFFGTATTNTLPLAMLSYMGNQFDPSTAAISVVQMVIAIFALLVLDPVYSVERLTTV